MNIIKRKVDVVVISDIHLGTYGSKAEEVLNYLKTVKPRTLILNGDIIDIWQFNKRFFPQSHLKVIKYLTSFISKKTKVYYITGNHDEMLRKFSGFTLGNFELVNKVVLTLGKKKAWFFHGDVFDVTMQHSKWLAKLGGYGYDFLILINSIVNNLLSIFGLERISFSKRIKDKVKGAVKAINSFETTAAEIAINQNYDYVVCGHIHKPQIKKISNKAGKKVTYLNSGDWVENMTALEYNKGKWSLYEYQKDPIAQGLSKGPVDKDPDLGKVDMTGQELFSDLVKEFDFKALRETADAELN